MVVAKELERAADILQGEKDDSIMIFNEETKNLGSRWYYHFVNEL